MGLQIPKIGVNTDEISGCSGLRYFKTSGGYDFINNTFQEVLPK